MTEILATGYDATNLYGIPRPVSSKDVVSYYLNGDFGVQTVKHVESLFPGVALNPIDVIGNRASYALTADVESGDLSPADCDEWVTEFRTDNPAFKRGIHPKIYCDRANIPAVRVGTGKYLLGRDYLLWVATGDGTVYTGGDLTGPYAKSGVAACQDKWYRLYDSSAIFIPNFA